MSLLCVDGEVLPNWTRLHGGESESDEVKVSLADREVWCIRADLPSPSLICSLSLYLTHTHTFLVLFDCIAHVFPALYSFLSARTCLSIRCQRTSYF